MKFLTQPWPWYVAGPLIGLIVPLLLIMGNKSFGISSSFRHICAACIPAKIPFFQYNWKKEVWNLFFVGGITLGGFISASYLMDGEALHLSTHLKEELHSYGIYNFSSLVPLDIFTWDNLFSMKGVIFIVLGGFLVGFGTRYAGGCTSGHAIMGLSTFQWPSLVATISFMIGGIIMANFILPFILSL